jgi:hypothetical protein
MGANAYCLLQIKFLYSLEIKDGVRIRRDTLHLRLCPDKHGLCTVQDFGCEDLCFSRYTKLHKTPHGDSIALAQRLIPHPVEGMGGICFLLWFSGLRLSV